MEEAASLLNSHQTQLIDLRDFPLPLFSEDLKEQEGVPEAAYKLVNLFKEHNALVVSVAEHNASITAVFKNAMDWVSQTQEDYRVLKDKPVWLLSTSPSNNGGANALGHSKAIFSILGAEIAAAHAIRSFYDTSQKEIRQQVSDVLKELRYD